MTIHTDNKETLQNALKRIEELENENALLKGRNEGFEQQIMGLLIKYEEVYKRFPDLKSAMNKAQIILKENAELKKVNAETLSQLNLDNGELIIENEKLLKENAELKEHIKADCIDCADYIKNQKLEKENTELKDKNTEAKEIIRALLFHLNKDTFAVIYETREESIKKAEQFLKETE